MILKLKRLWCNWFFHPVLYRVHHCGYVAYVVWCPRCDRYYGVHEELRAFVPWSRDMCMCEELDREILRRTEEMHS